MNRYCYIFGALLLVFSSCHVFNKLTSTTTIQPMDSFILGNNEHRSFKVELTNLSRHVLELYQVPLSGGKHSAQNVNPMQRAIVNVDKNTALYITNVSVDTCKVKLLVTGDTGLSMGYKN
ncbi:MAG: hypothetical protein IPN89_00165 [Saprospiraceae bacterium]|nr:hypothetical protein [Saprospiraceae bacterium]